MTEYLTDEEYRQKEISLIKESIEGGQFQHLSPRAQQILTERYLEGKVPSRGVIGNMLEPPIGHERVRQIEAKALRMLRKPIIEFPIDVLGLPVRGRNALIRAGFGQYPLDQLAQLSDQELQFIRGVGVKTARELREKLPAHLPQQV